MFRRLVVATDLSPASERVVDCVAGWGALGLRLATLVHVHAVRTVGGLEEVLRRDHEPKLERQAERLRAGGVPSDWRLAFGVPYLDLNRIAADVNADAVVIGSHGASWLGEVLLGSVADAILRHSVRPVLVLKVDRLGGLAGDDCGRVCGGLFARVLFPTDFSDAAERALGRVAESCRRMGSAVHVLHVQDVRRLRPNLEGRLDEFNRVDRLRMERLADHLRAAGAGNVSHEIAVDHPVRAILAVAERWKATLVVMGRTGRGWLQELALGSTAHEVARRSTVPVLVDGERSTDGS
jgi:nucleotide-binding universal stress UspA family protein